MSELGQPGVWVGLKRCGCCVAVCVDTAPSNADAEDHARHVEKTKRDFLKEGLSVVYGTWDEWQTKYLPSLKRDCGHNA